MNFQKISFEDILNENGGVLIDEEYLLSKQERLSIKGMDVKSFFTFEEYILNLENDRVLEIPSGELDFSVSDGNILKSFVKQLYFPVIEDEKTYVEIIFESDEPCKKLRNLLIYFL